MLNCMRFQGCCDAGLLLSRVLQEIVAGLVHCQLQAVVSVCRETSVVEEMQGHRVLSLQQDNSPILQGDLVVQMQLTWTCLGLNYRLCYVVVRV